MSISELLIIALAIVVAAGLVMYAVQRNRAAAELKSEEEEAIDENLADARKETAARRTKKS